jgi:hypothetical protein
VATSLEDSTEAGIRLALGMEEVDHRTADVGLASLAAEFSLPTAAAAAAAAPGVRREAEEEEVVVERGNGFGVSAAREALAMAAFTPLLLPLPPPPRSLRREAMPGARVWGSSEMTRRNGGWFGLVRGMDLAGCS